MPKVSGDCGERLVRYYYNASTLKCTSFLYSGCGGNENNFDDSVTCSRRCERKGQYISLKVRK